MKFDGRILTLSNVISGIRILIVPFLVWMILSENLPIALALLGLGLLTDYLDGHWARKYEWITNLGKILDPAADKLLMAGLFIPRLVVIPFGGWWWWTAWLFVPLLIAESTLVFGGLFAYWVREESNKLGSNIYGKMKFTGEGLLAALILVFPKTAYGNAWLIILITSVLAFVTFCAVKSIMDHLQEWREVCLK